MSQKLDKIETLKIRIYSNPQLKNIEEIVFSGGKWEIYATYYSLSKSCPTCDGSLAQHAWSHSHYLDEPIAGDTVNLHVTRPRFRCDSCKRTITPLVLGLDEKHRVTDRLIQFIKINLWSINSLRSLAANVGSTAKTVSQLLTDVANKAKLEIEIPADIGIHELHLNKARHLLLSNLAKGTSIDFIPDGDNQLEHLTNQLICFNKIWPTNKIIVPANLLIAKKICSIGIPFKIELTMNAINSTLAKSIIGQSRSVSKKGKVGSISKAEASNLAFKRKLELTEEDYSRFVNGIRIKNEFWEMFEAKEKLLDNLESTESSIWFDVFQSCILSFPPQLLPIFHSASVLFSELKRLDIGLCLEPTLTLFDKHINSLQSILLKPGKSFSTEMISALIMASPFLHVPIILRTGTKGSGHIWLEETSTQISSSFPKHAGVSIADLVNLLSIYNSALH